MIRSVFESAASVHPEMHHSKSRAMYGVDVMLDSNFQPKLLEVRNLSLCVPLLLSGFTVLGIGQSTPIGYLMLMIMVVDYMQ